MNKKREPKSKAVSTRIVSESSEASPVISSKAELKTFLTLIKERIEDESAAPIYVVSAMNYALNTPEVYGFLDQENKELARDIWLRIVQSGLHVRVPSMLFSAEEEAAIIAG
jgi:hypothetical protein